MKRHHIVGIIAGICAIGLVVRGLAVGSALPANISNIVISFILLSGVAIPTFFKDKLPSRWAQEIIPLWMCIVIIILSMFEILVLNHLP